MSVHFLFLYTLFIAGPQAGISGTELAEVAKLFRGLWPAIAALFVSHGISFFVNFLGRREYEGRSIRQQMTAPYRRIVFMHLVLILGGGISMILGDSRPVLMAAICLKVVFDVLAHLKERRVGE
jgi:chromate transport protein ChrA